MYVRIVDNVKWYEIDDQNDLDKTEYLFSTAAQKMEKIDSIYGGYWRYDFIDFNYLYNLYFPTDRVYNELKNALPRLVANYPSGSMQLRKLLSRWFDVPCEHFAIGNGASELIRLINRLFVKKMTIPVPGFNEYENTLRSEQINYFFLAENDFRLDPDQFVRSVKDSASNSALIINPNNPTSIYEKKDQMLYVLKELKDLDIIIVDESFSNFVDLEDNPSLQDNYRDYNNLLLVKSLSKEYGIPGLRLGYVLSSSQKRVEKLCNELPIWNINSFAEYFLEIFIKYQDEFIASCEKIIADRRYLLEELSTIPYLKSYPAQANYIFAKITDDRESSDLKNEIFRRSKVLIKDCSNKPGLEEKKYIRVAVRKKEDNRIFINALRELC
jgi:histidinol-phosphate/aromatic aminotransferase/cobyric acid decarboxylase-like protein